MSTTDRVTRAQQATAAAGLDAILVTPGPDLRYLAGYAAMPLERLTCLVVPASGHPTLVVPKLERPAAEASGAGAAAEIAAAGHEVAAHGDEHKNMLRRGPRASADDIRRCRDTLAELSGVTPVWFRPPFGILSYGALRGARRAGVSGGTGPAAGGLSRAGWGVAPPDPKVLPPA